MTPKWNNKTKVLKYHWTQLLWKNISGFYAKSVFLIIFLPPSQHILSENFTISSNAASKVLFFWFNNSQANF
jgi:hypothetical protein